MTKRRIFTAKFKAQVVLEVLSGTKSTAEACREYNLQSQVLNRWKAQFLDQAHTLFETSPEQNPEQHRLADLEQMVGRLTMELEAAKKASALLTSPLKPKGGNPHVGSRLFNSPGLPAVGLPPQQLLLSGRASR